MVNPEMPIPIESSLVHGVYDEDVKDAPTFERIAPDFSNGCMDVTSAASATVLMFRCLRKNFCEWALILG